jgi:EmrB/QacA subfamily drug resistance transporter
LRVQQAGPTSPEGAETRRWKILAVTQVAAFMSLLDVSIVNVALPSIQQALDASAGSAQWVVSGYALAVGLALVPAGRLGDVYGRRPMFLAALAAFVATSAASGAAPSLELLVCARVLQGIAAGSLTPQVSGLIQELFQGAERGRAFGVLGATIGLSTAVGPVVGGLILAAFGIPGGWRWVFYVNVPIGIATLAFAARMLPRRAPSQRADRRRGVHLDIVGSLLLGGAVLSLMLPLVQADGSGPGTVRWLAAAAPVLAVGFVWWEGRMVRRDRQPLLDPRLARVSGYLPGLGIGTLYFLGFTGIWLVLARFFQDGLGYSPLRSGLSVTPFALGVAASAVIAGRLVARQGRRLTVAGLTAVVVGLVAAAVVLRHVDGDAASWAAAAPLLVGGIGGGMVTSPNLTLTLESVSVDMAGVAAGALQTCQRIGGAVGTTVLVGVFSMVLRNRDGDYAAAVTSTLLCAAAIMGVGLVVAVAELVRRRARTELPPPSHRPELHLHNM